jgi:putative ABC transport system substrate-binding protein
MMRRREFMAMLGTAAAWPLAARAQQGERVRRIGVLSVATEDDLSIQAPLATLRASLAQLGWVGGHNLQIDLRFGSEEPGRFRTYAAELVNLAPEAIITDSAATTRAVQEKTQTIPIVITAVGDPAVNGLVRSLAHPEGNITGITNLYSSIGSRWLELLKEAVPGIERVALVNNPQLLVAGGSYLPAIEEAAQTLRIRTIEVPYRDPFDLVRGIDEFATEPKGSLIILPPTPNVAGRQTVFRLAAQHRLPTIYQARQFAAEGGLLAYGSVGTDRFRRAASFVDRILRGAKVSDLPVEFPTKFELVVNLKTAKAIGLTLPPSFLARADEVIE